MLGAMSRAAASGRAAVVRHLWPAGTAGYQRLAAGHRGSAPVTSAVASPDRMGSRRTQNTTLPGKRSETRSERPQPGLMVPARKDDTAEDEDEWEDVDADEEGESEGVEEGEEESSAVLEGQPTGAADEEELPELRLDLPPATNVRVKLAKFVKSSVSYKDCPPEQLPEFAVVGRSNVGKSSLINMLLNRKELALTSKQPGKTRLINHYLVNGVWHLVDLPGYGFARTAKSERKEFESFTKEYFKKRKTLVMVLLLVDSSIPPQQVDLEYAAWLGTNGIPFSLVFTKLDKRKKRTPKTLENMHAFKLRLLERFEYLPQSLACSAHTGQGKPELLNFLASLRTLWENTRQQEKQRRRQRLSGQAQAQP